MSKIQDTEDIYIYHEENPPIPVCKLVADEIGNSDILDGTLSGRLCGIVSAAECGDSRDLGNCHSVTELGGLDTTSAGLLFAIFSTALGPLTSGMTCCCVAASTPSVSVLDEGSPSRGPSNPGGDDVR